jgi:SAM-dependent methyltransferase
MICRAAAGPSGSPASSRVCFVVGDGCRAPFRAGEFDLVISGATLHHVADPVAFFAEIDRVLASDGHLIFSDLNRGMPRLLWPLVRLADWIERRIRPEATRHLSEGFVSSFEGAYDPGEIRQFLSQSPLGRRVLYYPRLFQHWIQTPAQPAQQRPGETSFSHKVNHDTP